MTSKPENPSAFPTAAYGPMGDAIFQEGMTLRDYFAAGALQGLIATGKPIIDVDNKRMVTTPTHFAAFAYEYANAMLAARGSNDQ